MPFANQSKTAGLDWIGEAFPEVLSQRMATPQVYVVSREDRTYAFNRTGVPATLQPSRATIYSVAEQMDADYVVMGCYDFDGTNLTAHAQLLDMKKLHLFPPVQTTGLLTSLIDVQTALAWELLRQMPGPPPATRDEFLKSSKPIRLDAFENYVRGVLDTDRQQKIRHFREAIRLNPSYTLAMLQLGKTYYDAHENESAAIWLARIPKDDPLAGQANFLLGMAEYYRGNYDKAYAAFSFLATRLPLTEVYNNIGVVEGYRGHRSSALDYFTKAINADPSEPDYHFNAAVALFKTGDNQGAARHLRETLQRRPSDAEAKTFLDAINRGATAAQSAASSGLPARTLSGGQQMRVPLERIKRNYDEASYRQLEMEIHNLTEERMAQMDRKSHALHHLDRGNELLGRNALPDAEKEFREAVNVDPNNAAAHAGLARVLEQKGDVSDARAEAQSSLRLQPNPTAYLVLARLDLEQNQVEAAADAVNRALKLDPGNSVALALQRDVTAKQTGPH